MNVTEKNAMMQSAVSYRLFLEIKIIKKSLSALKKNPAYE